MTYDVGDDVEVIGEFRDGTTGALLDPTTVKLTILRPDGYISTMVYGTDAITKSAVGIYKYVVDATLHGTWKYRWFSTGTGKAAEEGSFNVRKPGVI